MKKTTLLVSLLLLGSLTPAQAQYHYGYGNSRVTNQNQTGLFHPEREYIGCGTLSKSAQGKVAGIGSDLPVVNMGSHIRTPGDTMYNGQGTMHDTNGSFLYQDQYQHRENVRYQRWQRQQQALMQQQQVQAAPQQRGNFYVPGSNGDGTATYATQPAPQMRYNAGGAASYGGSSGNGYGGKSGARQF
jgi:hypothetical protein